MLQQCMPVPQHLFSHNADSVTSVERSDGPGWKRPMPRVSSMLFDLELEDQESGDDVAVPSISRQLLKLLHPRSQEEHQLGMAVNAAYEKAADIGRQLCIDELADVLRRQGYDVRIRTALGGGGGGGECLRNLRHQFLTLNMTGQDGVRVECIIDPSFAEQWGIARPTPAYARVVAALPQVYVGSAVEPLVDFLCSELAAAFRAEGTTLPPWRAADAMLSKWRPRRSVDCDMLSPPGTFHPSHSPFDAAMAHLSRHSAGGGRPSKSQRLSGVGVGGSGSSGAIHKPAYHASASLYASPRASPKPSPRGSFLAGGSYMGGRPLAMDKSASRALSDAEAAEAADAQAVIAAVAKAAAAELMPEGFVDGYADGGDVSDSSNDSIAATTTDVNLHRSSGAGHQGQSSSGTPYRVGRRASAGADLSTLSSSWRASDCMPFGGGGGGGMTAGSPHRGSVGGGAVRMSLEGVSTSDGSDTTQVPAAPPLALQGRLISAPPCLPRPATGSAPQVAPQQLARIPSAPQPPAGPVIEADFDFPKPVPAKSALSFARRSAGAASGGGGGLDRRSNTISRVSGGSSRNSGGRIVKYVPPLESGPGRQTSFPFDAASKSNVLAGMHITRNSGLLSNAHSTSAGDLSQKGGAAAAPVSAQGVQWGLPPLQGGPLPVLGTSPSRRAAAVREQFGMPSGRRVEQARRSLFSADGDN